MEAGSRNGEVIRLLEEIGDLLEVKGELGFKINAYRKASRAIEALGEDVAELHAGSLRITNHPSGGVVAALTLPAV